MFFISSALILSTCVKFIFLPSVSAVEVIESVLSVCVCVCACVCVLMVCVCRSIMAKGLWGEGTLQHGSWEVCQCSGVFIMYNSLCGYFSYIQKREFVIFWAHLCNLHGSSVVDSIWPQTLTWGRSAPLKKSTGSQCRRLLFFILFNQSGIPVSLIFQDPFISSGTNMTGKPPNNHQRVIFDSLEVVYLPLNACLLPVGKYYPLHYSRWAHMHRFLSVCLSVCLSVQTWSKIRLDNNSYLKNYYRQDFASY